MFKSVRHIGMKRRAGRQVRGVRRLTRQWRRDRTMTIDKDALGFGAGERAPYASNPWRSRGRLLPEPASPTRSEFQRDRDRIVHSNAFRRLKHKTQVFIAEEGDHFRTRLTHTIEVSQIARALARALKLDEDLAEGIALVHDFGHTPFGHTGEDALDEMLARIRRLRSQRPVAAHRHLPRAPLCRIRRPQPDLGDARGARQAQRPPDGCRRERARRPGARGDPANTTGGRTWIFRASPAWRRRWRPSPTTSPTTRTTSTTG